MQFSEKWLRSFVNPPMSTEELSHVLTMAGLEVEEQRAVAPAFSKVVVAHIMSVESHPNADKLKVCQVDVGAEHALTIVCGAPNVAAGMKVPCALVGAKLPAGKEGEVLEIKPATLRGVDSQGMLCSSRELGLSQEHSGLWCLPEDAPVGRDLREVAQLDDTIFVVKLTPDKGHCLSILGIAREVSALTSTPLSAPQPHQVKVLLDEVWPVRLSAPSLCGRFAGRVIRGVNAQAPTPIWMKERLERSGQRSISALVDISNYVMLEIGRPSHIFDADKIDGDLDIRWAQSGETLTLLNGSTVELDENFGVVADAQEVLALAGIMGGEATAVSLETRNIYLEAAFWWPKAIRGRARRLNFSTDAAHRFERGVDYASLVQDMERISALILDICGGQCGPIEDHVSNLPATKQVTMRVSRASRVLGIDVSVATCADIFTRLGFSYTQDADVFVVTPPSYRFDIEIEEDLIEEVARLYGYERIPLRPPVAAQSMKRDEERSRSLHTLRELLSGLDYQETVNYAFVEESWEQDFTTNRHPLKLLNPISSQMSVMRSSLLGNLIHVLKYNLNRCADRVRVFEIGRVFWRDDQVKDSLNSVASVQQPMRVAGLAYGSAWPDQWGQNARRVDFFDVKADLEALCVASGQLSFSAAEHPALHPGRSARVFLEGVPLGWLGELHPRWQQKYELPSAPVLFEIEAGLVLSRQFPKVEEPSKFPPVRRDVAIVVKRSIPADVLMQCIQKSISATILREVILFDEYRGEGLSEDEKSLAFHLVLQDTRSTLLDHVVDAEFKQMIVAVEKELGGRLR